MIARACQICGAPHASRGFGLPGARKDLPPGKRGYVWTCAAAACIAAAEARREAAISVTRRAAPPPDAASTRPDDPAPRLI